MAELVDALASGASGLMVVEVQVLFSAPNIEGSRWEPFFVITDVIRKIAATGEGNTPGHPGDTLNGLCCHYLTQAPCTAEIVILTVN